MGVIRVFAAILLIAFATLRGDGNAFTHGQAITLIMPLGDSITQGQNLSYGSYRNPLYTLLNNQGIRVNFVGELEDGTFPSPHHEGLTGYYIEGIWAQIENELLIERFRPAIILLLIGTNDIWHVEGPSGGDPAVALGTLGSLLASIAAHGPNVKTIVASIPPIASFVAGSTVSANVNVYNAGIPAVVATAGSKFSFIDVNAALTTSDLTDGVHPSDAGNDLIAPVELAGILAVL